MENHKLAVTGGADIRFQHMGTLHKSNLVGRQGVARNIAAGHTPVADNDSMCFCGFSQIKFHGHSSPSQ
jgi:hypothetical protein